MSVDDLDLELATFGCDRCGVSVEHRARLLGQDDAGASAGDTCFSAVPEGWSTLLVNRGGQTIDAFDVCAPCLAVVLEQFPDPITEPERPESPESEDVP